MRFRLFGRVYTLSKKIYVFFVIIVLALVAVIGRSLLLKSKEDALSLVPTFSPSLSSALEETSSPKATETPAIVLAIYVSGEVSCPGVYWVSTGTIIGEVVELAGGFTEKANTQVVNLALRVEDGMHIHIPDMAAAETDWLLSTRMPSATPTMGKVNLNTATLDELMTLSGIGESTAKDILQYRSEYGPFTAIEDIMNVPGIKQARFDKIKDWITV